MEHKKGRIVIVVGTVREGRAGRAVADWYRDEARSLAPEWQWEVLDIRELGLPLFREEAPPLYGQYSAVQASLAKTIEAADGFVFVTGEYNKSLPGSLKNFLDYVYGEWNRKAAAVVSYGGVGGGLRAAEHLVQVLNNLGVAVVRESCSLHRIWEALDASGKPKSTHLFGGVAEQLEELGWWVQALKAQR